MTDMESAEPFLSLRAKTGLRESRTLIVQNFLNNLLLNKVDQESLWVPYAIMIFSEKDRALQCNGAMEKHNDPEEDELRRQQCMEVLSPAVSRLTDVLLLKDIPEPDSPEPE